MSANSTLLLLIPKIDDGGVERVMANISNYIHSGYVGYPVQVKMFVLFRGNMRGRAFFSNYELLEIGFWGLVRLCFNSRNNIIIFSALTPANILGSILAFLCKVKFYPSQQCVVAQKGIKPFFRRIVYFWIYLRANKFIAISEGVYTNLYGFIGKKEKLLLLYNPVLIRYRTEKICRSISPKVDNVTFCSLGRLTYQKGFDLIIQAFGRLLSEGIKNFKYFIAGDGDQYEHLRDLVSRYDLSNHIYFSGFTTSYHEFYSMKDFYLFPSRFEGLGLALVEALDGGIPVISSNCLSGPSEILENGRLGRLVHFHYNVDEWANILRDILLSDSISVVYDIEDSLSRFSVERFLSRLLYEGNEQKA